jgi:hypothetical protein
MIRNATRAGRVALGVHYCYADSGPGPNFSTNFSTGLGGLFLIFEAIEFVGQRDRVIRGFQRGPNFRC